MPIADRQGLTVAAGIAGASPDETQLAEATLRLRFTVATPQHVFTDRAPDRDPLAGLLANGTCLSAPYKYDRTRTKTQEGRELRRSRGRRKIQRVCA